MRAEWGALLIALVGCRGGGPAPASPADGLPGLDDLGFAPASSDFTHGFVADSALEGNVAYLAGRTALSIVDLTDPGAPRVLASVPSTAPLNDVTVVSGFAYVTAGERDEGGGALIVYDVSDPSAPTEVGRLSLGAAAIGISVIDGIAYIGGYAEGFVIVDVHDPAAPVRLATWQLPDADRYTIAAGTAHVWWPAVRPPYAYVTYDGAGLHVLDVSDPTTPVLVGSFDRPTPNGLADCFFNEIELDGDRAYVAVDYCGVLVLDVSDPANVSEIALVDIWDGAPWDVTPGHAIQLEREADRLFVTTSRDGLYVFDVASPAAPQLTHAHPGSHAAGRGCAWGMTLTPELLVLDYTLCLPVDGITGGVEVFSRR